ncbi:MAG: SDR family NAD(P)-dependent oxidoreductase [Acidobacteria bacterium]|nr:SDR family NAD(P)-dependent oxidoreductase [Acidobacteriota bacterium]
MSKKLEGKVVLVTGASSGIGEATALALAAEGARVALLARRADRLEALAARIREAGGEALPLITDLADEAQARSAVLQTHQAFGRLDILINNAGIMLLGFIDGADTEEWRRMIDVNVLGLFYATHAALPLMKAQGGGHIVNVSSVAGRKARAGSGVYSATKWAVGAFTESLRVEVFRHNIRVSLIEPGAVDTELREHISDAKIREQSDAFFKSITPLQSPDIAAGILYAITQAPHVNVNEVLIRPVEQEY